MQYKGFSFRKTQNIVILPNRDDDCILFPHVLAGYENYVYFGRVVKIATDSSPGVIKTKYTMFYDKSPVYAKVVPLKGHSLTNMAYGEDGRVYLAYNGNVYTAKRNLTTAS